MNDLKFIIRKMKRSRIYSVINIMGLAVALATTFLIYSHVIKEWKTDDFHAKKEQIYRVTEYDRGQDKWSASSVGPLGPALVKEIPGISGYLRVMQSDRYRIKTDDCPDFVSDNRCIFADAQFFDFFDFPILSGTLLQHLPGQVVISQKAAGKFFPGKNPIGEKILIKDPNDAGNGGEEYQVVAVMKDFPAASSLQADFVIDFFAIQQIFDNWSCHGVHTFLKLEQQTDVSAIEQAIPKVVARSRPFKLDEQNVVKLQRLSDIYLGSDYLEIDELLRGSVQLNLLLSGIALLILVLAFSNYLMIRMARLRQDLSAFAVRSCYGAPVRGLSKQLWLEIIIHLGMACLPAFLIIYFVAPYFVSIISAAHPYVLHLSVIDLLFFILLLFLFAGIMGGILSSYAVRRINRNAIMHTIKEDSGIFDVKKILTVLQLSVFVALLFCSVVLIRQMEFIKDKKLGFQTENVLGFGWPAFEEGMQDIISRLMAQPGVLAVSNGEALPQMGGYTSTLCLSTDPDRKVEAYNLMIDSNYINTLEIHLLEGQNIKTTGYPNNHRAGKQNKPVYPLDVLVNEQLVKQMGLENPVGTVFLLGEITSLRIVGVVEDFHFFPLYRSIEPLWLDYNIYLSMTSSLIVRYQTGYREAVLDFMEKQTRERFPNLLFQYTEYNCADFYSKDMTLAQLVNVFTLVAIFIGGMGILAFSIFLAETKRKEVAIRKINGATEWQIIGLLNLGFMGKVILSCIIGIPIAYYMMVEWLQGFAYQTRLEGWIFVLVVAISLGIVFLITSWQVWKIARINPVDTLKKE